MDLRETKIYLPEEQFNIAKETAKEKGITVSEYFRDILSKQSGVEVKIDFADIDEYSMKMEELVNQLSGICATIYRTNKAYEQDVQEILRIAKKLDEQSDDIWRFVMDARTNLYDDTRKKLYGKVSENGYKRRRKNAYSETKKQKKQSREMYD